MIRATEKSLAHAAFVKDSLPPSLAFSAKNCGSCGVGLHLCACDVDMNVERTKEGITTTVLDPETGAHIVYDGLMTGSEYQNVIAALENAQKEYYGVASEVTA